MQLPLDSAYTYSDTVWSSFFSATLGFRQIFFFGQIHSSWSQSRWQKEQAKIWKARSTQWFWMAWVHQWSTLLLEEKYVHLCIFFFSAALVGWFWFFSSQMNSMLFMPSYKAQQYCNKTASKWISVRTMLSLILQKQKETLALIMEKYLLNINLYVVFSVKYFVMKCALFFSCVKRWSACSKWLYFNRVHMWCQWRMWTSKFIFLNRNCWTGEHEDENVRYWFSLI